MFAWMLLLAAIGVEGSASAALSRTVGFRDPFWTVLVVGGYDLSIWLLTVVVKQLPISIAYAVWAGLGFPGTAVVGVTDLGYGLNIAFSDGHWRGIYPKSYLLGLAGN